MEHMNRLCIRHLGTNKTKKAICRTSKCMSFLSNIIDRFNKEHKYYHSSGTHSSISSEKDRDMIIEELMKCSVFKPCHVDIMPHLENLYATPSKPWTTKKYVNGLLSTPKAKVPLLIILYSIF